ncbi:MAG TPA: hypothetical protein VJ110_00335 [Candidatus Nanoarchaeia archaeon]|nr:hypothetical protein [Candidatus Nanoarchaeia archaeon]
MGKYFNSLIEEKEKPVIKRFKCNRLWQTWGITSTLVGIFNERYKQIFESDCAYAYAKNKDEHTAFNFLRTEDSYAVFVFYHLSEKEADEVLGIYNDLRKSDFSPRIINEEERTTIISPRAPDFKIPAHALLQLLSNYVVWQEKQLETPAFGWHKRAKDYCSLSVQRSQSLLHLLAHDGLDDLTDNGELVAGVARKLMRDAQKAKADKIEALKTIRDLSAFWFSPRAFLWANENLQEMLAPDLTAEYALQEVLPLVEKLPNGKMTTNNPYNPKNKDGQVSLFG